MPTFKVTAIQWVQEVGELEVEAATAAEAMEANSDEMWDWSDGDDSKDFEVTGAEEIDAEDPDEDEEDFLE